MKKIIASVLILSCSLSFGSEVYKANCSKCHGDDGKGETAMGKRLSLKSLRSPEVQAKMSDDQMKDFIKKGLKDPDGKTKMKPYAELSELEIKEIVKYVRSLKSP